MTPPLLLPSPRPRQVLYRLRQPLQAPEQLVADAVQHGEQPEEHVEQPEEQHQEEGEVRLPPPLLPLLHPTLLST